MLVPTLDSQRLHRFSEKLRARLYSLPDRARRPMEYVFILSHMRSGSSLLVHLLASHPEILGYGETQTNYVRPTDLDVLVGRVMKTLGRAPGTLRERYVLDKVLHNHLMFPDRFPLLDKNVRVIFLLREPVGMITSQMRSLGDPEHECLEYYLRRLPVLSMAAAHRSGRDIAVTYAQLTQQPEATLRLIERHLELTTPLQERYEVLPTTGKIHVGDVSPNIHAGVILTEDKKAPKENITLQLETVRQAQAAYEECWATLQEHCRTLDSPIPAGQ